jgi:hypothetical protein
MVTLGSVVQVRKTVKAPTPEVLRDSATGEAVAAGLSEKATPGVAALDQAPAIFIRPLLTQVVVADDGTERGGVVGVGGGGSHR